MGREKRALHNEASMMVIGAAQRAGMTEALDWLTKSLSDTKKDISRRALTVELPAPMEPLRVVLKPGANFRRLKAELRPMPSDKEEWPGKRMGKLEAAGMVLANLQEVCASATMVVPKAGGSSIQDGGLVQGGERAGGVGARANAVAESSGISLPGGASVLFAGFTGRKLPDVFELRGPRDLDNHNTIGFVNPSKEGAGRHACKIPLVFSGRTCRRCRRGSGRFPWCRSMT